MAMTQSQAPHTVGIAVADALARAGVKVAFTVPGESTLGILEGLTARHIRVVTARHEGAAAFMADAVGQLTGRLAVCIAARGPGAANLAVGLHTARQDSAPVLAIVGQVRRDVMGREAFQEMDIARVFEPIVKWAVEVTNPADVPAVIEQAIATATHGRPGPVVVSIPEDVVDLPAPEGLAAAELPRDARPEPDPTLVRKVLHLLTDARRPLILAGSGVLRARSSDALARFAEVVQVPVVAAWRRPDVFANDHPLYLGMAGLGAPANVRARLEEADALLVLGCRLSEMTTFGYRIPAEATRWAQVDLEPRAGGRGTAPEVAMAADVAGFLRVARRVLAAAAFEAASFDARRAANVADREAYEAASTLDPAAYAGATDGDDSSGDTSHRDGVSPVSVIAALGRLLPPEAIVTTDAGDFSQWASRGYRFRRPGTFLGPTSGAMGFGLPAAIAASLARPGRIAVALAGDGGFAMTMAELETAVRERAHLLALVFDNARFGTIHRRQADRGMPAGAGTDLGPIDFAAVAAAAGALGLTVRSDDELEGALRQALEAGRPAVVHLHVDRRWTTPDRMTAPIAAASSGGLDLETAPAGVTAVEPASDGAGWPEPQAQPEAESGGAGWATPDVAEPAEPAEPEASAASFEVEVAEAPDELVESESPPEPGDEEPVEASAEAEEADSRPSIDVETVEAELEAPEHELTAADVVE